MVKGGSTIEELDSPDRNLNNQINIDGLVKSPTSKELDGHFSQ
jgi:hypothetical protein